MTTRAVLLLLLPLVAGFALLQRRRLYAILGMAVFSLLLAAVYLLAYAPDVAITEAALGSALVTFVYILAIRKTGRLVVAGSETPGLLQREDHGFSGLEWEILRQMAAEMGLDLVIELVAREEIEPMILRGEADVGAGGLLQGSDGELLESPPYLPTALFDVRGPKDDEARSAARPFRGYFSDLAETVQRGDRLSVRLDLARFLALSRFNLAGYSIDRRPDSAQYVFRVSPDRQDVARRLASSLLTLRESGELDRMIGRYFS